MPNVHQRRGESRNFDCLYDPNYITATKKDAEKAKKAAQKRDATIKAYSKYQSMFNDGPKTKRVIFRKQLRDLPAQPRQVDENVKMAKRPSLTQFSTRLRAGANDPNVRNVKNVVTSPSECKSKPPGLNFIQPCTKLNVIDVQLDHNSISENKQRFLFCEQFMKHLQTKRFKTRGTQSIYRVSSAQTLPYLPGVSNKENELAEMELFKLPTILPGDGPPGLYEVEVLERARKRWAFAKALQQSFQAQLESAKERAKLPQNRSILQAFEWEHWIEREEYIQECQMLRLELLIGMFNKREKEMHIASKSRIEMSYEKIAARRETALRKNEIEFGRQMRQLELMRQKVPRNWRKENIVSQLGSARSEFYAPQQRYGVNPSRRHFRGGRKAFEARIDDLEKRVSNTTKLVCPYAKLKEWSKPKQRLLEIEQNFCSDENLRKMYESLTGLREKSLRHKVVPKCLVNKAPKVVIKEHHIDLSPLPEVEIENIDDTAAEEGDLTTAEDRTRLLDEKFRQEAEEKRLHREFILHQHQLEETEALLCDFEGTTIGWLMRFLSEELSRLQEQHILHYITMLAQKERWRREAAEAGLRQKENEMRQIYEQLYIETHSATGEVCREYINNIIKEDIPDFADFAATTSVVDIAKLIDKDIERWLDSIACIQNPNNFEELRHRLKDIMFPDLEQILHRREQKFVIDYIVEDVIFNNLYTLLDPIDIGTFTASEAVDRSVDNDLLYFTSENSSTCSCQACTCSEGEREARAILRKAIRYAVPGRRWKTPTERVALENANDIIEEAFKAAFTDDQLFESESIRKFCQLTLSPSHMNIFHPLTIDLSGITEKLPTEALVGITKSEHYRPSVVKKMVREKRKKKQHLTLPQPQNTSTDSSASEPIQYKKTSEALSNGFIINIVDDINDLLSSEPDEAGTSKASAHEISALKVILERVFKAISGGDDEESEEEDVIDAENDTHSSPLAFEYSSMHEEPIETVSSDKILFLEYNGQITTFIPDLNAASEPEMPVKTQPETILHPVGPTMQLRTPSQVDVIQQNSVPFEIMQAGLADIIEDLEETEPTEGDHKVIETYALSTEKLSTGDTEFNVDTDNADLPPQPDHEHELQSEHDVKPELEQLSELHSEIETFNVDNATAETSVPLINTGLAVSFDAQIETPSVSATEISAETVPAEEVVPSTVAQLPADTTSAAQIDTAEIEQPQPPE